MNKGLYNRENEHDACGVGLLVNIHGHQSHDLVEHALKVLEHMVRRKGEFIKVTPSEYRRVMQQQALQGAE